MNAWSVVNEPMPHFDLPLCPHQELFFHLTSSQMKHLLTLDAYTVVSLLNETLLWTLIVNSAS